jgi:hypothetical protein
MIIIIINPAVAGLGCIPTRGCVPKGGEIRYKETYIAAFNLLSLHKIKFPLQHLVDSA